MGIPVFLSSSNSYAAPLCVCMTSMLSNTKSDIDFYIFDSGITVSNKNKILFLKKNFSNFSIEFIKIDVEHLFKNFIATEKIPLSTYSRLLIPTLKPDLKKVIYIDADTIVLDDIQKLYDEDLEEFALGACFNEVRRKFNSDTKIPMQLSENYRYFNAGVLLIDVQKWIKDNIVEKLFEIEKKYRSVLPHQDESLLNKYFDENYKVLSVKYNYTQWDYDMKNEVDSIVIRHYITREKPWQFSYYKDFLFYNDVENFWHYAKMTPFYNYLYSSEEVKKYSCFDFIIKMRFEQAKGKFLEKKRTKMLLERMRNTVKRGAK